MITIDPMTGTGAILQRDRNHVFFGKCEPRQWITAYYNGNPIGTVQSSLGGHFMIVCTTQIPVGGPYTIDFECGSETASITDVRVGDNWLVAGQSNAYASDSTDWTLRDNVRAYGRCAPVFPWMYAPNDTSQVYIREEWYQTGRMSKFGALCLNHLEQNEGIPQGILQAAYPGTPIQKFYDSTAENQSIGSGGALRFVPPEFAAIDLVSPYAKIPFLGCIWWLHETNIRYPEYFGGHLERTMQRLRQHANHDLYFAVIGVQNITASSPYYTAADQQAMRVAQKTVCDADPNAVWIRTEDITPTGDLHPPLSELTTIAHRTSNAIRSALY